MNIDQASLMHNEIAPISIPHVNESVRVGAWKLSVVALLLGLAQFAAGQVTDGDGNPARPPRGTPHSASADGDIEVTRTKDGTFRVRPTNPLSSPGDTPSHTNTEGGADDQLTAAPAENPNIVLNSSGSARTLQSDNLASGSRGFSMIPVIVTLGVVALVALACRRAYRKSAYTQTRF
jgi:hypothetical protein